MGKCCGTSLSHPPNILHTHKHSSHYFSTPPNTSPTLSYTPPLLPHISLNTFPHCPKLPHTFRTSPPILPHTAHLFPIPASNTSSHLPQHFLTPLRTLFCTHPTLLVYEVIFKYRRENSTVIEGDCEVSLRSLSQQPPIKYVNCDRLQPRIEPSRRICHLRTVPLGHVADRFLTPLPHIPTALSITFAHLPQYFPHLPQRYSTLTPHFLTPLPHIPTAISSMSNVFPGHVPRFSWHVPRALKLFNLCHKV